MRQFIFWAGHLYWPFLVVSFFIITRKVGAARSMTIVAVVLATIAAYARFVEPRILRVEHSEITLAQAEPGGPAISLALIADTHFGFFKNAMPMQRIVDRINREAPDAVLIAGDFLYYLPPEDIPNALAPLANLQAPVFAVLGNHDVGFTGPIYTKELYAALTALGVTLVENRAHAVTLAGQDVMIAGASDLWEQQQDFAFSAGLSDVPTFLLTHNPDTALNMPANVDYNLMLAGHTHGGQIRIPWLYRKVIPTDYPFDIGLHRVQVDAHERLVFVTPGTGMVGLPFRLNMPPRIDLLDVVLPTTLAP